MVTVLQRPLPVRGQPSPPLPVQGQQAPRREPRPGATPTRVTPGRVLELGLGAAALGGLVLVVQRQPGSCRMPPPAAGTPASRLALDCAARQGLGWLLAHLPGGSLLGGLLAYLPLGTLLLGGLLATLLVGPALLPEPSTVAHAQVPGQVHPCQGVTLTGSLPDGWLAPE